jgi:hypothetical protein
MREFLNVSLPFRANWGWRGGGQQAADSHYATFESGEKSEQLENVSIFELQSIRIINCNLAIWLI